MCMWECVYVLGVGIESQCETIHSIFFLSLTRYLRISESLFVYVSLCMCVNSRLYVFLYLSPSLFIMAVRTRDLS